MYLHRGWPSLLFTKFVLAAEVCSCSPPNRRAQLYSEIAGSWGVCSHFARCWKEIAQCDAAFRVNAGWRGGGGWMRRGHQPIHTAFAKQGGSRESERERERKRQGQRLSTWVDGNLRSGKGFVWVTIAIGSGAGVVISWDNWGVDKRYFCAFLGQCERIVQSQRR